MSHTSKTGGLLVLLAVVLVAAVAGAAYEIWRHARKAVGKEGVPA